MPVFIKSPIVIFNKMARCLHRNMRGLKGQIAEKRAVSRAAVDIINQTVESISDEYSPLGRAIGVAIEPLNNRVVNRQVRAGRPIIGTGGIKNQRTVKAVFAGKFAPTSPIRHLPTA